VVTGHFVWCDPPSCDEHMGVHRSRAVDVRTAGGSTSAHLYRIRSSVEPWLICGPLSVSLSEARRVMSFVDELMAPRIAEEVGR